MGKRTEIKIINALSAISITEEPDGICVRGPKIDRKIELLTEDAVVHADNLESMGSAEGQDFFHCISIAGRKTGGKVWREAVFYTSKPGEECPLRLSFYKEREDGSK